MFWCGRAVTSYLQHGAKTVWPKASLKSRDTVASHRVADGCDRQRRGGNSACTIGEAFGTPTILIDAAGLGACHGFPNAPDAETDAIAPRNFETDINSDFLASDAGQKLVKRIPMRRTGQLEDLEGALFLLTSDRSALMTGAILPVDGRHLASGRLGMRFTEPCAT